MPMHDVVPRAVKIAVATDAMICTMNFSVSFLLIILCVLPTDYTDFTDFCSGAFVMRLRLIGGFEIPP